MATDPSAGTTPGLRRTANQTVALLFGAVDLLVGLVGFLVDYDEFAGREGGKLLGLFEVNGLHNVAHLAIGLVLLLSSRALGSARGANTAVGAAYLLLGVLGPFVHDEEINVLALNGADDVLHLASAALLLAVGLGADRDRPRR